MSFRKYPPKALFCVYKISFIDTDKFYIGSANNSQERIWCHVKMLRKGNHKNKILQNCFNKYGQDNIIFEILEQDLGDQLRIREQYYIDTLNPYINISKNVKGHFGLVVSEENKKIISEKIKALHKSGFYKTTNHGKNPNPYKRTEESQNKIVKKYYEWCEKTYEERNKKILELLKDPEMIVQKIATTLNISRVAVNNFLKKNNLQIKKARIHKKQV